MDRLHGPATDDGPNIANGLFSSPMVYSESISGAVAALIAGAK